MTVSNQTVQGTYVADGTEDSFAIPFAYTPGDVLNQLYIATVDPDTGIETEVTSDFSLSPNETSPTHVVFDTPPADDLIVIIARDTRKTQEAGFSDSGPPFPAKTTEKAFDRILMMLQEVWAGVTRSIRLSRADYGVDATLPPMAGMAGRPPVVNEDEDGFTYGAPSDGSSAVIPAATAQSTLLESDADLEYVETAPIVFDGISALTGGVFTSQGIKDTLDKIIRITYTPPQISLSGTGSGTLRERGDTVTNPTLTAVVTKRSDPIASLSFYDGIVDPGNIIGSAITADPPVPNGGSVPQVTAVSFSTNRTFRARVTDDGATGGPTNVDASVTYSFVYPYYYGPDAASLTAAQVAALTKQIINETTDTTRTFNVTAGEVLYFAYPASYGVLTSILDQNNFETIGDWTLRVENITGLDGNAVSYNIYEFNNPIGVSGNTSYRFRQ